MKPCPKCGSNQITFGARAPGNPPGRIFICRRCLHYLSCDTPDRGSDISETRFARDSSALAQWERATAKDLSGYLAA